MYIKLREPNITLLLTKNPLIVGNSQSWSDPINPRIYIVTYDLKKNCQK